MPSFGPILDHVAPWLMVLFRLSGLLVFAPILASSVIPMRVRTLICVGLAAAIYPTLPLQAHAEIDLNIFSLGVAALGETLIGVAIGLLAALPLFAVQLGGLMMSTQAGMSLGQIYNPALETESDLIGQFLLYAALVIFVMMGGLEALFVAVGNTFTHVPIGHATLTFAPVELLGGVVASGFDLALRISAPVLCIIMIETLASSMVSKMIPMINVQSIGFAVKIVITLLALLASVAGVMHASKLDMADTLELILQWSTNVTSNGAIHGG